MAILVEKHLEIDFKPILPCRNMLRKLKRYIKRHHQIINGSQEGDFDNEEMSVSSHKSLAFSTFEDTQECIDDYLQAVLPDQYPFAKEKDFKNKFFDIDIDFDGADEHVNDSDSDSQSLESEEIKLREEEEQYRDVKHKKALLVERLIHRKSNMVNLKEFRDQLLQKRSILPVLISWGLGTSKDIDDSKSASSEDSAIQTNIKEHLNKNEKKKSNVLEPYIVEFYKDENKTNHNDKSSMSSSEEQSVIINKSLKNFYVIKVA